MPTARELLEQADALMRRNRAAAAAANEPAKPALPLGGPGSTPPLVSPRTIQREPIAPSIARTALPVEPSESPFIVPGAQASRAPPESPATDEEAVVPVLTEAVSKAGDASIGDLDDVPILTDVVEEIEMTVAGPVDDGESAATDEIVEASARGEPSLWPDAGQGDASILGPAPDSVVVVPPPELAEPPRSPPAGRDPLGFDQPARGFMPPEHAETVENTFDSSPGEAVAAPAVARAAAEETRGEAPFDVEPALGDERPAADVLHAEAPHGLPPPAPARTPDEEEARVRAIAEEIGMQVLQRIDIFTDTTLRERLGERLKPVVERVSAELVDALNQHVGELLRAHVAEAIEREIETWRDRRDT